jgi:hypothetical protein
MSSPVRVWGEKNIGTASVPSSANKQPSLEEEACEMLDALISGKSSAEEVAGPNGTADFGMISYRDDAWSTQYRGKQTQLAQGAAASIEVIIVKASKSLCSDGLKNLAIVPLNNLRNEEHGGPMLLRVPVSSLEGMALLAAQMQALGFPYYSFGVRISIDNDNGQPKFLFNTVRALTDEEADVVIELQALPLVTRILVDRSLQKSSAPTAATPPIEPRELKGGIYSEADALPLLNSNFFLADQGSAFPIARITGNRIEYVGDKDFKNKLANIWVRVLDTKGEVKQKSAEPWWRQNEGRAERRIIFDPKRPPGFSIDGAYNIWTGFDVLPEKGWQKQRRLLRHIREVICAGDKIAFKYLMRWLAWCVQHPDRKAETMIVLKSAKQGTGKTTLNNVMSRIFGRTHARTIYDKRRLFGQFTPELEPIVFIDADEMVFAGDHDGNRALKSIITSETIALELKGGKSWQIPNRFHIIMTTNGEHAVQSGVGDRRNFVLEVSPHKARNDAWFAPLYADLEGGGLEEFLWLLQNLKLKSWHPRQMPTTKAAQQQQRYSGDSISQWAQACIDADCVETNTLSLALNSQIQTDQLYESYSRNCRGHRATVSVFGKALTEMFGQSTRGPRVMNGSSPQRPRLYNVPDANNWQAALDKRLGI